MIDVEINNLEQNEKVNKQEKIYKKKDYVRRANNKYRKKKYAEDLEYKEKQLESCKQSQKKYNEKYKEHKRQYMREYRAKKKAEKQLIVDKSNNIVNKINEQINTLIIK